MTSVWIFVGATAIAALAACRGPLSRRARRCCHAGWWNLVFPIGMYAVTTHELGRATGSSWMTDTDRVEIWVATASGPSCSRRCWRPGSGHPRPIDAGSSCRSLLGCRPRAAVRPPGGSHSMHKRGHLAPSEGSATSHTGRDPCSGRRCTRPASPPSRVPAPPAHQRVGDAGPPPWHQAGADTTSDGHVRVRPRASAGGRVRAAPR